MSQYDAKIVYIKGEENMVADALSWLLSFDQEKLEKNATHIYTYCLDDMEDDMVSTTTCAKDGPCSVARSFAKLGKVERLEVCTTFEISADGNLLAQV